jgi:hypothetical protein
MELFILCLLIFISFFVFRESKIKRHILTESFKPDGRIFTFCHNYDEKNMGDYYQSSYDLTEETKKKGLYTTLANKTMDYDFLTNAPLCVSKELQIKKSNYFPNVSIINYKNNTYKPPLDPFDTYSKPDDNYSILFHPSIQSALIKHNQEKKNELLLRENIFIDNHDPSLNTPSTSR